MIPTENAVGSREDRSRVYEDVDSKDKLMTLEDFRESVRTGALTDNDGHASPVIGGKIYLVRVYPTDVPFFDFEDFTHIVWYNR